MSLRFVFLADCQLGAYASFSGLTPDEVAEYAAKGLRVWSVPATTGFEWDARQLERAIDIANAEQPAFVVMGGDMVDDLTNEEQFDAVQRITSRLDPDIAMRWVPGNHDIAFDTLAPTAHSIDKYRELFGPDYYTFEIAGVQLVVLNTVVLDHPEHVPGELDEQLEFLSNRLAVAAEEQITSILFGHHPLFTSSPTEDDSYWNVPAERRRVVLDLIHAHRVPVMFAGHWHRNAYSGDGGFEMVTSGPVGYPLGDDPPGYRVVSVENGDVHHEYHPLDP